MFRKLTMATITILIAVTVSVPTFAVSNPVSQNSFSASLETELAAKEAAKKAPKDQGFLQVEVRDAKSEQPVTGAKVTVLYSGKQYTVHTDKAGQTETLTLPAPDLALASMPVPTDRPFGVMDVTVEAKGFVTQTLYNVAFFSTVLQGPIVRLAPGTGKTEKSLPDHQLWVKSQKRTTQPRDGASASTKNQTASALGLQVITAASSISEPASIRVCLGWGTNCQTDPSKIQVVPFETWVARSVEGEIYCNWNVTSHYVLARATRTKGLYHTLVNHKYSGYDISYTEVNGYELGKDDSRRCQRTRDAVSATNKQFLGYQGQPIDALYMDFTGSPSLDGNSYGLFPYLASHYDEADESLGMASSQGYGLSQYGTESWANGFVCGYDLCGPMPSTNIEDHYYDLVITHLTAN